LRQADICANIAKLPFPGTAVMVSSRQIENTNESPDSQAQLSAERRNAGTPERFIIT